MAFFAHNTGKLVVLNQLGEIVALKVEGDCFGEVAVLLPAKRSATVVALGNVVGCMGVGYC